MPEVLRFPVGVHEQYWVQVYFDKFMGGFRITVDGAAVVDETQLFGGLTKDWPFVVGVTEQHQVIVRKQRKLLFAGFRPQRVIGIVDGAAVAEGVA